LGDYPHLKAGSTDRRTLGGAARVEVLAAQRKPFDGRTARAKCCSAETQYQKH